MQAPKRIKPLGILTPMILIQSAYVLQQTVMRELWIICQNNNFQSMEMPEFLFLKKENKNNIDYGYLNFILKDIRNIYGFGWG